MTHQSPASAADEELHPLFKQFLINQPSINRMLNAFDAALNAGLKPEQFRELEEMFLALPDWMLAVLGDPNFAEKAEPILQELRDST